MCLRRAPEKNIAGATLDMAGLDNVDVDHKPIGPHGDSFGLSSRNENIFTSKPCACI
jgi:hypothetical protein